MRNNKGFIAISLIYSFFLVFLVTLLMVVNEYAHNRVLLNDVKKETQEYLNGLAEFNPVQIENRNFVVNEEIIFGSEIWKVIGNTNETVTLRLNRNLTSEEIQLAIEKIGINDVTSGGNNTLMCLKTYSLTICNYENDVTYNYYSWDNSIVKKIVDVWFDNNASLQKALQVETLQNMNYSDEIRSYDSYIRIPTSSEYSIIGDNEIWYLTSRQRTNGISYLQIGSNVISTHNNYKKITPVIMVKKTI